MADQSREDALDQALKMLLEPEFAHATLRRSGGERISVRLVEIKGRRMVQVSNFDGRRTDVKNFEEAVFPSEARALLEGDLKGIAVSTAAKELRIQFSKKGRPIVHEGPISTPKPASLTHDRVIARPLPEGEPNRLLRAIGLMTADGKVKADRRRKFVQINEFIRLVMETEALMRPRSGPLLIIDFGCGNAYLSFALHHFLNEKVGIPAELIGVDRTPEIIARNRQIVADLGAPGIEFVVSGIADYIAPRPADIVTALHACDTATDEALAKALEYGSSLIFAAPCCHHHLQAQPGFQSREGAHVPLLQDGILRERLADLVTDASRALILRIAGYRVEVIEFTSPDHTAKNLLIRARRSNRKPDVGLVSEYKALKNQFGVAPYLESIVPDRLRAILDG